MIAGDRVLLPFQSSTAQNGIYIWNGAASAMTRASDADTASDFYTGFLVYVYAGSTYTGTSWVFTTSATITLGTTPLAFTGLTGAAGPTGGTGPAGPTGGQGPIGPAGFNAAPYAAIQDQKTQNTGGGTFTSGAWRTRDLNTLLADRSGIIVALAANQVTLGPGTYKVEASAPAYLAARNQTRLQNVTDGTTLRLGSSEYCGAANGDVQVRSYVKGEFALQSAKVLELQHQCQTTAATLGFGVPSNFGTEVYSTLEIWLVGAAPPPPGAQHFAMPNRRPYLTPSHNSQRSNTTLPI